MPTQAQSARMLAFNRFKHLWWLKGMGTCLFMWIFFHFYFLIMRAPATAVTIQALTSLDIFIPFQANWFYVYASLWLYTSLAPALMPSFFKLLEFGLFIGLLCALGLLVFYLFPTAVPYKTSHLADAALLKPLHDLDQTGNAFPSLHVACATFCGFSLHATLRDIKAPALILFINVTWCLAIVFSTLAIKQHTTFDVFGGIVLAIFVLCIYRRWRRWR